MKFYRGLLIILVLIQHVSFSQDIQLSQFYAASLYQNPAFAGSAHLPRLTLHERVQWPSLDAKYFTSMASADLYFSKYRSGLGLMFIQDVQGSNIIKSTEAHLQYAYELYLSSSLTFRAGLQAGFASRNINYVSLIYPDQYNDFGYSGATQDITGAQRVTYADISSGGILYSKRLWIGFSFHHINQPNQSFIHDVSRLPVKCDFVMGYKFIAHAEKGNPYQEEDDHRLEIIPTIHYKFQGKSDQFDAGIYALYHNVISGIWYRGIPIKHYMEKIQNNESVVLLAGYKWKNVSLSYSYDITVSRLNRAGSGGAHELNITYVHRKSKKKKIQRRLPCPKFNDF